jgi:hypothetical protein
VLRKHKKSELSANSSGLLNEADALIEGDYLEYLLATRQAIPGWAWLNPLAHRSVPRMVQMARTAASGLDADGWSGALSSLAANVVRMGGTADGVRRIQRDALVSFELELLAGRWRWPMSPSELVSMVESVLEQHGTFQGS